MKRKDISNCWSGVIKDFDDLNNEIKKLRAENEKLREVLGFYADEDNYTKLYDYKGIHYFELIGSNPLQDRGDKARYTLAQLSAEKEGEK